MTTVSVTRAQFPVYKSVWYWNDDHLNFYTYTREKSRRYTTKVVNSRSPGSFMKVEQAFNFHENVDKANQRLYRLMYARQVSPDVPNVVTIQDIKDVITYLMVGDMPLFFLEVLHSFEINPFLRALIVYFQLYLQVLEDLKYRKVCYSSQRLKHPISFVRETRCRKLLSRLRCLIGQEYAHMVTGEGVFRRVHHMNNPLYRSYDTKDIVFYEYLLIFSARIVWVALARSNYREIELEISRLFRSDYMIHETRRRRSDSTVTASDRSVLDGPKRKTVSHWEELSPVIADIFDEKDAQLILSKINHNVFETDKLSGLDAALNLPEELLTRFGLSFGILGQPRESYEAMLHVKPELNKSAEEKELHHMRMSITSHFNTSPYIDKPSIKMYQYLEMLETPIDLNYPSVQPDEPSSLDIRGEIEFYRSYHRDDSKKSYTMWRHVRGSNF